MDVRAVISLSIQKIGNQKLQKSQGIGTSFIAL